MGLLDQVRKLAITVDRLKGRTVIILLLSVLTYMFWPDIHEAVQMRIFPKDRITSFLDNDIIIQKELEEMRVLAGADRAYIFRFHNGVRFYNGSHKNKMSCEYEVTGRGVSHEAENLQDIPVTLFSDWIKKTINGEMVYTDISFMDDHRTRYALEQQGINGIIAQPYFRDGSLFAIVGFDYTTSQYLYDVEDKDLNILVQYTKEAAEYVGGLLI